MSAATENVLTLAVTGATLVACAYFGAGIWSLIALTFLCNLNKQTHRRDKL